MALGSLVPTTDSPVLVITSAIAIGVVFVLIMLLIVLRARHMALRRREAMRIQEQWEAQLILRFQDKPPMHQVWLSSPSAESSADDQRNGALNQSEWDKIMPLFAFNNATLGSPKAPCEEPMYSIGVLLRLPHPKAPAVSKIREVAADAGRLLSNPPQDAAFSGSEIIFGFSVLPVVVTRPP